MENMKIYNGHREVPREALKTIKGGRLAGMSDINPMFRIKSLTEDFGPCGVGWYYTVDKQWLESCDKETVAFVNISLFVKVDGEWSKPIFGTGGSKLITMERSGAYVSDEAFKMATTDALSVACKQLGYAANIYWESDKTKYNNSNVEHNNLSVEGSIKTDKQLNDEMAASVDRDLVAHGEPMTEKRVERLKNELKRTGNSEQVLLDFYHVKSFMEITEEQYISAITTLLKKETKNG